ncbi:MAG: F0F1 ATP synthase subunit gamma [Planctomycetota bacterium]
MQTLAALERKIRSADDLLGVVRTMKALAAVNIRQYEKAVQALQASADTVESALRAVLRRSHARDLPAHRGHRTAAVIFGSDQGMCGPLNERIVRYALAGLDAKQIAHHDRRLLAVGVQVAARLGTAHHPADHVFPVPGSVAGITELVYDLLDVLDDWQGRAGIARVMLFHCRLLGSASWEPTAIQLLPFDRAWLDRLAAGGWSTRQVPLHREPRRELFSALLHHYLFIALFRATGESLASENASRLSAMQVAETHIGERLDELQVAFQQERQTAVTAELLDIISGFLTLRGEL